RIPLKRARKTGVAWSGARSPNCSDLFWLLELDVIQTVADRFCDCLGKTNAARFGRRESRRFLRPGGSRRCRRMALCIPGRQCSYRREFVAYGLRRCNLDDDACRCERQSADAYLRFAKGPRRIAFRPDRSRPHWALAGPLQGPHGEDRLFSVLRVAVYARSKPISRL